MEKFSMKKQLTIVRLYLNGLSYSQIVAKTGVSQGTVANVIAALKAGQFPEAQLPAEQIELLHELATDLHHLKLNLSQAAFAGLMGVSLRTVQDWEQGRRKPSGPAEALLRIAEQKPEVFTQIL